MDDYRAVAADFSTVIPAKAGIHRFADNVIVAHPLAFNSRERDMSARPGPNLIAGAQDAGFIPRHPHPSPLQ